MSPPRYYPRYAGKADIEPWEPLYVVVDSYNNEELSARVPYHDALRDAHTRNGGRFPEDMQSGFWALPAGYIKP